jgi:hypothetical protein
MTDLTEYAINGFNAKDHGANPHLYSSATFIAWNLGRSMWFRGMPQPRMVKMSRGYTIRASDMLFRWIDGDDFERLN